MIKLFSKFDLFCKLCLNDVMFEAEAFNKQISDTVTKVVMEVRLNDKLKIVSLNSFLRTTIV